MALGLVILGLAGLWLGTKCIIEGALGIARRYNLSHSFVGVGILALGTDLPEIFVSLKASYLQLQGIESSGIITGNALGSCISQITLILGVAAFFMTFHMAGKQLRRDGIALLGSIVLLYLFGLDGHISRLEGGTLLLIYLGYYLVLMRSRDDHADDNSKGKDYPNRILVALLLTGFIVLIFASNLVVENAMLLAERWGVAQSFVGVVIIGLGTSLPELAVSIGAAMRKAAGMSVGNVIGSNIFDTLVPVGLGGAISHIQFERSLLQLDIPILFLTTFLVFVFLGTKKGISRREGIWMVAIFFLYLVVKFLTVQG